MPQADANRVLTRRDIGILVLLGLAAAATAMWQKAQPQPLPADDIAIRAVISEQVDAFRRGDDRAAYTYAAPDIQAQFSAPDDFMAMVKAHYKPVLNAHKLSFAARSRNIQAHADMRRQEAFIIDAGGLTHHLNYFMQNQPDGSWKIAGCQLLPATLRDV